MSLDSLLLPVRSHPIEVLVIGQKLHLSYSFTPLRSNLFRLTAVSSLSAALAALASRPFELVCCSAAYKPLLILRLMEAVKQASTERLIPFVLAVDLSQRLVTFPTSTWAGRFGLVSSQTSPSEWQALLERLLPVPQTT